MNKIKENWRALLVLSSVVWAVFAYAAYGLRRSDDVSLVLGPFVIAMAIYFLFPKRKEWGAGAGYPGPTFCYSADTI